MPNKAAIEGWLIALQQMRFNQKCTVIIPSSLAYKKEVMGEIPADSTLVFDMVITSV
jgi:FKBP-type peptidyl-prolyl cis-trans isomerase